MAMPVPVPASCGRSLCMLRRWLHGQWAKMRVGQEVTSLHEASWLLK